MSTLKDTMKEHYQDMVNNIRAHKDQIKLDDGPNNGMNAFLDRMEAAIRQGDFGELGDIIQEVRNKKADEKETLQNLKSDDYRNDIRKHEQYIDLLTLCEDSYKLIHDEFEKDNLVQEYDKALAEKDKASADFNKAEEEYTAKKEEINAFLKKGDNKLESDHSDKFIASYRNGSLQLGDDNGEELSYKFSNAAKNLYDATIKNYEAFKNNDSDIKRNYENDMHQLEIERDEQLKKSQEKYENSVKRANASKKNQKNEISKDEIEAEMKKCELQEKDVEESWGKIPEERKTLLQQSIDINDWKYAKDEPTLRNLAETHRKDMNRFEGYVQQATESSEALQNEVTSIKRELAQDNAKLQEETELLTEVDKKIAAEQKVYTDMREAVFGKWNDGTLHKNSVLKKVDGNIGNIYKEAVKENQDMNKIPAVTDKAMKKSRTAVVAALKVLKSEIVDKKDVLLQGFRHDHVKANDFEKLGMAIDLITKKDGKIESIEDIKAYEDVKSACNFFAVNLKPKNYSDKKPEDFFRPLSSAIAKFNSVMYSSRSPKADKDPIDLATEKIEASESKIRTCKSNIENYINTKCEEIADKYAEERSAKQAEVDKVVKVIGSKKNSIVEKTVKIEDFNKQMDTYQKNMATISVLAALEDVKADKMKYTDLSRSMEDGKDVLNNEEFHNKEIQQIKDNYADKMYQRKQRYDMTVQQIEESYKANINEYNKLCAISKKIDEIKAPYEKMVEAKAEIANKNAAFDRKYTTVMSKLAANKTAVHSMYDARENGFFKKIEDHYNMASSGTYTKMYKALKQYQAGKAQYAQGGITLEQWKENASEARKQLEAYVTLRSDKERRSTDRGQIRIDSARELLELFKNRENEIGNIDKAIAAVNDQKNGIKREKVNLKGELGMNDKKLGVEDRKEKNKDMQLGKN